MFFSSASFFFLRGPVCRTTRWCSGRAESGATLTFCVSRHQFAQMTAQSIHHSITVAPTARYVALGGNSLDHCRRPVTADFRPSCDRRTSPSRTPLGSRSSSGSGGGSAQAGHAHQLAGSRPSAGLLAPAAALPQTTCTFRISCRCFCVAKGRCSSFFLSKFPPNSAVKWDACRR